MPECDDDDSSSDSDHEPDFTHDTRQSLREDNDDENQDDAQDFPQTEFKWDGVGDIQELKLKNSDLAGTIKDYKNQINQLQVLLEAVEPIPGLDINSLQDVLQGTEIVDHDIRNVKIVHQAKKLRQLKVALTREKTKGSTASSRIAELEQALHQAEENILKCQRTIQKLHLGDPKAAEAKPDKEPSIQMKKYDELRIKYEAQTIELKKTQRILQREVGEDVSLQDLLQEGENGKRGRAQKIVMLKAKVKKLEKDLQTRNVSSNDVDTKAEVELQSLKQDKQKLLDQANSDLEALKDALEKVSRKYDGQKARVHVLEKDSTKNKTRVNVLLEKSRNDDALIDAMQQEMDELRMKTAKGLAMQIYSDFMTGLVNQLHRARTADSSASKSANDEEIHSLRSTVAEQKRQIAHQETTIESFRRDLQLAEKTALKCQNPSDPSNYQALAVEKERLAALVKSLQQQLEASKKGVDVAPPPPSQKPDIRSRLPRLNSSDSTTELDKLRRTIEAKDEEIATWKEAFEAASSRTPQTQNARLVADLEAENERLRDQIDSLHRKMHK